MFSILPIVKSDCRRLFITVAALLCAPFFDSSSRADTPLSATGRLDLSGVQALESDSAKEDPGFQGQLKVDANGSSLRFHSWLEGVWDGSVARPPKDHRLFKDYDRVYQSNTPYLEFKELYVSWSANSADLRAGIQRFAWGRIDEYPSNDLLNPWDFSKFPAKPLEDRKIGVPSLSASLTRGDWTVDTVWVPVFVPYRLPLPQERWSGSQIAAALLQVPGADIEVKEPDLPERTVRNSTVGMRAKYLGAVEWTLNLFHGYDPRPIFKTTTLSIVPAGNTLVIDPGYVPDFHRITTVGIDAAAVKGDWSLRAEASYGFHRYFNIRNELWGYPEAPAPGIYPLNEIEQVHDSVEYGLGADYRLFEDGQLTLQAQQSAVLGNIDLLYEKRFETILWANLKAGYMNQKIETNLSLAWNPEHDDHMMKANAWYVFTDAWKAGLTYTAFNGSGQSYFGRYSRNDEGEAEIRYSW
ncbi:MAG: hypothetical protein M0042_01185 [Nitrospiraceae bacterium]|nr:hypothetical protein [Nitrospiraceae bacterium]